MNTSLVPVPPETLGAAWEHLCPHVERLAEITGGRLTAGDIRKRIESELFQLWAVLENGRNLVATVTTEVIEYPQRKTCRVVGCVGENRASWIHLLTEIEGWAQSKGCASMEIFARKGWARVLPDYRLTSIVLERDL